MANISAELAAILAARYGRDVRGSIHDAIDKINKASEVVMNAGTAVDSPTSSSTGYEVGSFYFNTSTSDLWKCAGTNSWTLLGNLKGADGVDGENGQNGEDGADGKGIASIVKTSTSGLVDTYTITYTDGTTQTYNVENGADGENGNKWYRGTGITGTNTNPTKFTGSGVTYAYVNDNYLNTSTGAVYHCSTEGNPNNALWVYDFVMSGGGSSITVVDNLTSQSTSDALSAKQGYVLKGLVDEKANISDMTTALAGKVDKVAGKGLSANDYTNTDKGIVDGVTAALGNKQDKLTAQTAYTSQGDATHVPQITTNSLGQVTGISEVAITYPTVDQTFNGSSSNAQSGTAVASKLDSWSAEATLASGNTVTFSNLNDAYGYELYSVDDAKPITWTDCVKSGSGSSMQLVYTVSGSTLQVGISKFILRILK